MSSVDNVFICLVAPMLLTLLLIKGQARRFNFFFIIGMTTCIIAGYSNNFLFSLFSYSSADASIYISPISEEILKALPILIYVIGFKPEKNDIISAALALGVGFATLENCYYITVFGSTDIFFILVRGFASGIMHAICTATIGFGMTYAYHEKKLDYIMTFGLLSTAITYHSIYNMLVSENGGIRNIGCLLPIITAAVIVLYSNQGLFLNKNKKIKGE